MIYPLFCVKMVQITLLFYYKFSITTFKETIKDAIHKFPVIQSKQTIPIILYSSSKIVIRLYKVTNTSEDCLHTYRNETTQKKKWKVLNYINMTTKRSFRNIYIHKDYSFRRFTISYQPKCNCCCRGVGLYIEQV